MSVITRVEDKLTGRDISHRDDEATPVDAQVDALIEEATSTLNLCQCYMGWGPFW